MPHLTLAGEDHLAGVPLRLELESAQVAVRLAAIVEPGHRLLAHIAALAERHRALVEPSLLGDNRVVEVQAIARPAALDPQTLSHRFGYLRSAGPLELRGQTLGVCALAEEAEPGLRADCAHAH